jgi:hypothetical protein
LHEEKVGLVSRHQAVGCVNIAAANGYDLLHWLHGQLLEPFII